MSVSATDYGAYKQVNVETASQGKLIVMLFGGAIKRAEDAKKQLEAGKFEGVHNNLIRAQDIVAELRACLDMKAGAVAENLDHSTSMSSTSSSRPISAKRPDPWESASAI